MQSFLHILQSHKTNTKNTEPTDCQSALTRPQCMQVIKIISFNNLQFQKNTLILHCLYADDTLSAGKDNAIRLAACRGDTIYGKAFITRFVH